jgi:hypothetical protein
MRSNSFGLLSRSLMSRSTVTLSVRWAGFVRKLIVRSRITSINPPLQSMEYNPEINHRRWRSLSARESIRLAGYNRDRSTAYFITIYTHDRKCIFGNILDR